MSKHSVIELAGREGETDPLSELLRAGAKRLIQQAVEAELQGLPESHAHRRTEAGTAGAVRNGYLPEHEIRTGVAPVTVKIPKIIEDSQKKLDIRGTFSEPKYDFLLGRPIKSDVQVDVSEMWLKSEKSHTRDDSHPSVARISSTYKKLGNI